MKRFFLVCGPESSGNRFVTKLLVAAGVAGDDGHDQGFDYDLWSDRPMPDDVVLRRSIPHGRGGPRGNPRAWGPTPDLVHIAARALQRGYTVQTIYVYRDPYCCARSQVGAGHLELFEAALESIRGAQRFLGKLAPILYPLTYTYEGIVRGGKSLAHFYTTLGLPIPDPLPEIFDANQKWLEDDQ